MRGMVIDLGCGTRKVAGAIGIDCMAHPGVNIICDFEQSLPLKSNSVDALHASHLLEHINNLIAFMEEIYRVCKPDALVYIKVPYFTSRGAFRDPTHVRYFTEETFLYFQHPAPYGIKANFKIHEVNYKYRTFFRIFPNFIKNIFRKHLWNVAEELSVSLIVQESQLK